jgi:hypothetical protein
METEKAGSGMKVLLLELNEITWRLIDPLMRAGQLPTFARLTAEGLSGTTISADEPPLMDPWTTWVTVYSGTPVSVHKSTFLQQPPHTIEARRLWDYVSDAGGTVGVYGSLNAWPPHPVRGFMVPDTFAPSPETYPPELQTVQEVNLRYTRGYNYGAFRDGSAHAALVAGARLVRLGLRPSTIGRIIAQLVRERLTPRTAWRRVSLQPLVNFDMFRRLWRRHRPDFATFHTNHVAHYQHLYWRAMEPSAFPHAPLPGEVETYADAIAYGYRVADRLLQQAVDLLDRDTVLVVASSMGQQPYVHPALERGKRLMRIRSYEDFLEFLGLTGRVRIVQTMADQFVMYGMGPGTLAHATEILRSATVDRDDQPLFFVSGETSDSITANLQPLAVDDASRCRFVVDGVPRETAYTRLVDIFDHAKSGYHHPEGIIIFYGDAIRRGRLEEPISTLDLAPTMLGLLGLPVPAVMTGRNVLARGPRGAAREVESLREA